MNIPVPLKKPARSLNLTETRFRGALAKLTTGVTVLGLTLTIHCSYAAALPFRVRTGPEKTDTNARSAVHSMLVSRSQGSRKNKIKLYPDARQQVLFFSANGEDRKIYQLYLFDMDGKLVSQTSIRNRETTVLTNISEGDYLFEVFSDDERIENGRLTVR